MSTVNVAENLMKLYAHEQVLTAEIAQIAIDAQFLHQAAKRYTDRSKSFTEPAMKLHNIHAVKVHLLKEVQQHLQLYALHHDEAMQLLHRCANNNNVSTTMVKSKKTPSKKPLK